MTETKNTMQEINWEEALKQENWVAPVVNLYETSDDFHLIAFMPGVSKENAKIKIEDDNLVLMGKIKFNEVVKHKYILKEIDTANYYRKFKLAGSVDVTKIEAGYYDGILDVKLPKHERVKPRNIEIK